MIASMESKIQQLASQLSEQTNTYKEMEAKYHRGEARVIELESKLKNLDSEYCATEVMRENLRNDHLKYLSFLERIGKILKINDISADFGMDMNIDVIIARAEQLIKMESESIQDKQTNIYNLQRKIKQLKEQLDNKELHLDLLRKKLSSLEEERAGKCALEKEVDDHVMMSKKFKVKVEKLTEQLNVIKSENENLKSQLFDYNGAKVMTIKKRSYNISQLFGFKN
jgi:chromosome segregation ATPase